MIFRKLEFNAFLKFVLVMSLSFGLMIGAILGVGALFPGPKLTFQSDFLRLNLQGISAGLAFFVIFPLLYLGYGFILALLSFWGFNWTIGLGKGLRINGNFTRESSGEIRMGKIDIQSYVKFILLIVLWVGIVYGALYLILRYLNFNLNLLYPYCIISGPWSGFFTMTGFPWKFLLVELFIAFISFGLFNLILGIFKGMVVSGDITREKTGGAQVLIKQY